MGGSHSFTAEQRAHFKDHYDALDTNNDSKLTVEELISLNTHAGEHQLSDDEMKAVQAKFAEMDADNNGSVSFEEFIAYLETHEDFQKEVESGTGCDLANWNLSETKRAVATINEIRTIVDSIKIPKAPEDKKMIPLSLGDPTFFGNLPPPPSGVEAIVEATRGLKMNGYGPAHGHLSCRQAVATKFSFGDHKVSPNDVMIASGCSDALKIVIHSVVGEGDVFLTPEPGFPLYNTLAMNNYATCRGYPLVAERSWEVDLEALEQLVDPSCKAILLNNPGNPTGSSWSRQHLEDIAAFCRRHHLIIISDEVYAGIVFDGSTFTSMAEVATEQPVIVCGGIAKRYCAPGWRLGWLIFYDTKVPMPAIRDACQRMTQLIVGCNTLIQAAVPSLLLETPDEYYTTMNRTLQENSEAIIKVLHTVDGLTPIDAQGAMYVLVTIDLSLFPEFKNDMEWCQALLNEEFVFVLPGGCFKMSQPGFRCVFCAPAPVLRDAAARMAAFCARHSVTSSE